MQFPGLGLLVYTLSQWGTSKVIAPRICPYVGEEQQPTSCETISRCRAGKHAAFEASQVMNIDSI